MVAGEGREEDAYVPASSRVDGGNALRLSWLRGGAVTLRLDPLVSVLLLPVESRRDDELPWQSGSGMAIGSGSAGEDILSDGGPLARAGTRSGRVDDCTSSGDRLVRRSCSDSAVGGILSGDDIGSVLNRSDAAGERETFNGECLVQCGESSGGASCEGKVKL